MKKWILEHRKESAVIFLLLLILAAPFVLRLSKQKSSPSGNNIENRLVIISPHNETIRNEFTQAFVAHIKETENFDVHIDWRTPGGTSEITKVIDSEVEASFQNYWKKNNFGKWADAAGAFNNKKITTNHNPSSETKQQKARRIYLSSEVGIGLDLFFGGGAYDFQQQANKGHLVASTKNKKYGISALINEKPKWFNEEIIPSINSGEPYYDPQHRWVGTCLSSFGICYNRDSVRRLDLAKNPSKWEDLANPAYYSEIALADPNKSGSVNKAFEMLLQEQMRLAVKTEIRENKRSDLNKKQLTILGLEKGWKNGLHLIQQITANARYFTDSATKIPLDIAAGDAAAGMCVDFYGRSFEENSKDKDSPSSRMMFVTPTGGSSYGVDPIAMFRGAPRPDLAHSFIKFVLSKKGQRLWNFQVGTEGGPQKTALRRQPIRKDLYNLGELRYFSDPNVLPYLNSQEFIYQPSWTAPAFSSIRFIIKMMAVDTHQEQKAAWKALIDNGFPPRATAVFHELSLVNYRAAMGRIAKILASPDRIQQVKLARDLADKFRRHYLRAEEMAKRNE